MKAMVSDKYGSPDVFQLRELPKPLLEPNKVLIHIHARSVNPFDWHFMRGKPLFMRPMSGLVKPKNILLGTDVAGIVEAVGDEITRFEPGDAVYGGIGFGGFAEYAAVPERLLVHKPANISFEEAAAVPVAGLTALQALRDTGKIQSGMRVLISGASGGVGTYSIQIAKAYGCEVTAVCSTGKVEQSYALGADSVIDYTKEDFNKNGQKYDLIMYNAGSHGYGQLMNSLSPDGIAVVIGWTPRLLAGLMLRRPKPEDPGRKALSMTAQIKYKDLELLNEWLSSGQVRSVIDRSYPFAELPEAVAYLEAGHASGKVLVTND
jgi:NADPH:quinone reductase-like Zn-dependent oxidoreductase